MLELDRDINESGDRSMGVREKKMKMKKKSHQNKITLRERKRGEGGDVEN